ncbi:MAG: peptidoglycan-binding protein [Clostridia bacterium]|nr:peptidoglycan-binding protein [Clostridia bacterium]
MRFDRKRSLCALAAAVLAALVLMAGSASAAYGAKVLDLRLTQEEISAIPPVLQGRVYQEGDDAIAVEVVKLRLQELGYYKWMDTFNTRFDGTMRVRLKVFQKNNAIEETGVTDETTMAVLFSDRAATGRWYNGEDVARENTLICPATNSARWYPISDSKSELRAAVRNISRRRTVKAFAVSLRVADTDGAAVLKLTEHVTSARIEPGQTIWMPGIEIPQSEGLGELHMAITHIDFTDGTSVKIEHPKTECWMLSGGEQTE